MGYRESASVVTNSIPTPISNPNSSLIPIPSLTTSAPFLALSPTITPAPILPRPHTHPKLAPVLSPTHIHSDSTPRPFSIPNLFSTPPLLIQLRITNPKPGPNPDPDSKPISSPSPKLSSQPSAHPHPFFNPFPTPNTIPTSNFPSHPYPQFLSKTPSLSTIFLAPLLLLTPSRALPSPAPAHRGDR